MRRQNTWMRLTATVATVATTGLWLLTPPARAQQVAHYLEATKPRHISELKPGLTQCLTPAQWAAVDAKRAKEAAQKEAQRPAVRLLSDKEMLAVHGRGIYRNKYLAGTLPWNRSLRDANLCTGNLFKSFDDFQVQPSKGAGLALQRTYNSNSSDIGSFGIGWTHAYDIKMAEAQGAGPTDYDPAAPNGEGDTNYSTRQDFFGHKHKYHRDADGLYTPPPYLYDEHSSNYSYELVNGPITPTDDTDMGMDGTTKHYILNGTSGVRYCDYIQDRFGNTTNLAYNQAISLPDGSHPLQTVTDPSGRTLTFWTQNLGTAQQPQWRVVQVDGPQYSVVYAYTADGFGNLNLTSVTLDAATPAAGVSSVVAGNAPHVARNTTLGYTSVSDNNGNTESSLLSTITDPLSHTFSYGYALTLPDAQGNIWPTVTNTVWVSSISEPATGGNQIWTLTVQPWSTAPVAFASMYKNNGGVNAIGYGVGVDSNLRFVNYFTASSPTVAPDPLMRYQVTYDSANNVSHVVSQSDYGAYFLPNQQSFLPAVGDSYIYGAHANVLTHTRDGFTGSETTTWYNGSQYFQKQSMTDFNGHTTKYGVGTDTAGNTGDPDPNIGDRGQILWVKDALYGDGTYNPTGTRFQYFYDAYGRKISETNQNNVVTNYTYGGNGDALVNGQPVGNLTQVVQDPGTGHLIRTTAMQYDLGGHVLQSTDPLGLISNFQYNNLGQPTSASFPAKAATPAETVSYQYDGNGRTHSVSDNRGAILFNYEAGDDRVSSVVDPVTGTVSYTYGLAGERRSMTLPGAGTWTYSYGNNGATSIMIPRDDPNSLAPALSNITDDQGRRVDYNLDFYGHLIEMRSNQTFSGTNQTSYLYTQYVFDSNGGGNGHGWLSQVSTTFYAQNAQSGAWTTTLLSENIYNYDTLGQRLSNQITDSTGAQRTESYAYDPLNRLAAVNYGDGETQGSTTNWQSTPGYTFDPMGNRLSKQDSVTGSENYSYNNANMLLTRGTNSYSNDLDGNTLTGGGRTNIWDSENRLAQCVYVNNGSTTTSNYTYGSDGFRRRSVITTSTGTTTTDCVLDNSMFVRELQYNAGVAYNYATYLIGPRGPEYRRDDVHNSVVWYVYDGLGSVLAEVNPSGTVTASRKYDVYGSVRSSTGTSTSKHKFVGSLGHPSDDESGLIYMRARYMDPATGRFTSEDPAKSGRGWYLYCANNPINKVDASGNDFVDIAWLVNYLYELLSQPAGARLFASQALMELSAWVMALARGQQTEAGGLLEQAATAQALSNAFPGAIGEAFAAESAALYDKASITEGDALMLMFLSEQLRDAAYLLGADGGNN